MEKGEGEDIFGQGVEHPCINPEDIDIVFGRDDINHPAHYTQGKIGVLDFILDQKLGYMEGNIVKYVCRYPYKGGVEDLRKARFYLDKLINQKENK